MADLAVSDEDLLFELSAKEIMNNEIDSEEETVKFLSEQNF